ncbi:MAG: hypothetical protein ACFHWZ_05435 [Phycisphaerales bacterium]
MTEIIVSTKHAESSAPSIDATEAAVAQHLALARLRAAEKIHRALDHDEPLSAGLHKLCVDALKLPLDRAAASPVATDPETVAPSCACAPSPARADRHRPAPRHRTGPRTRFSRSRS